MDIGLLVCCGAKEAFCFCSVVRNCRRKERVSIRKMNQSDQKTAITFNLFVQKRCVPPKKESRKNRVTASFFGYKDKKRNQIFQSRKFKRPLYTFGRTKKRNNTTIVERKERILQKASIYIHFRRCMQY